MNSTANTLKNVVRYAMHSARVHVWVRDAQGISREPSLGAWEAFEREFPKEELGANKAVARELFRVTYEEAIVTVMTQAEQGLNGLNSHGEFEKI